MWPFGKRAETRDSSYTDALVSLLVSRATGDSAQISATWAAEVSAILYARAFSAARVSPKNTLTAAITPAFLGQVGRSLVRRGESLHMIDMDSGRLELRPAGSFDVRGGPRESDWAYRIDLCGPSVQQSRLAPSAEVIHARYQTDPSSPWRGCGPLAGASLTSDLLSALELRLSQECIGPSGYIMPMPQAPSGVDDLDPLARLVADIKGAKGSTVFSETQSGGWGEGKPAAPVRDWMPSRFGANPPEALKALRSDAGMSILTACGIPPSLVMANSDGTAQRESYRRFIMLIIEPLIEIVRAELERKLETDVKFDLRNLWSHDLAGRAQAFQRLVAAGLTVQEAMDKSGLMVSDE